MTETTQRASCWSITINNPTAEDLKPSFPNNKWVMTGQIEKGDEGTEHYQGMLTTPQIRFSQVKKVLPRAHIEVAKNKVALSKYVSKTETRVATCEDVTSSIPTLFDYQHTIALKWDDIAFAQFTEQYGDEQLAKLGLDEIALRYVDKLVSIDIEKGICGIEYIAINPMWRSAWKKFWRAMISRERTARINSYGEDIENGTIQQDEESIWQEECSENSQGEGNYGSDSSQGGEEASESK